MYCNKSIEEIFKEFNINQEGLSESDAQKRLKKYGLNTIKEQKKLSAWKVFLNQLNNSLIYILLVATLLAFAIGRYIDMGVILAIIIIHSIIGFTQEYKAQKAMKAILKLAAPQASIIREGSEREINAEKIVPGDILILSEGNKVPADIRLFQVNELEIDESTFTGETKPVKKITELINKKSISITDQYNMAFMGTIITRGKGKGIVVNTGEKTELGKISELVKTTEKQKTPLQNKLDDFSKKIAFISIGLSLFVFIFGLIIGKPLLDMILFAISMAVAVLPEGLIIVVTIIMAVGLNRMAKRNALIRKLIAVETLGSCNYICADKTGTLTENKMTVYKAFAYGNDYKFQGIGYEPKGKIYKDDKEIKEDKNLEKLLICGTLCNSSELYKKDNQWKVSGDPTEGALIVAGEKFGVKHKKLEQEYELVDEIPFSSKRQYMATLHKNDGNCYIFVKGSPEKMLEFCNKQDNQELKDKYLEMTNSGLRVLSFGMKEFKECKNIKIEQESIKNLDFLGFLGLIDPPREGLAEEIAEAKEAGITTIMLTGDNKDTAIGIGKKIGLFSHDDLAAEGEDFRREDVEKIKIYARVSPSDKLKIVEYLQDKGNIVAVTGDGVNDAPALKKAAIGIAMGAGTDVAKEAAEMVLRDDNYDSIFEAVKEGRIIFENIRKVIFFLLCTSLSEASVIILALLARFPLPFLATQILWVNLVTNTIQDIALAYEPGEKAIFKKPPRSPEEKIANSFFIKRLILVSSIMTIGTLSYYIYTLNQGYSIEYARTAAVNAIVFFQFFNVLNSRSFEQSIFKMNPFSNVFLIISLIFSVIAQYAFVSWQPMQYIFGTTSLTAETWLHTVLIGLSVVIVMEADKYLRKKNVL